MHRQDGKTIFYSYENRKIYTDKTVKQQYFFSTYIGFLFLFYACIFFFLNIIIKE